MMSKFSIQTAQVVLSLILLFAACTERRDLSQNTVIVHFLAEPGGLHPTNDNNVYQRFIFQCTQKRLMFLDLKEQKLRPDVLESFP